MRGVRPKLILVSVAKASRRISYSFLDGMLVTLSIKFVGGALTMRPTCLPHTVKSSLSYNFHKRHMFSASLTVKFYVYILNLLGCEVD